jgi:fumarylpyruvate hydrolase
LLARALTEPYGYAIGLDMTRRDIQAEAKKLSRPWELAKSFDQSCPISAIA